MYSLPLFPLNTVLYPGMPLYLHVFEARYRMMTHACLEKDAPFGVVLIREGVEAFGPPAQPHRYGCTARIIDVEKLADGCMNLTVVGEERFHIRDLDTSLPYLVGIVESRPIENPHPLEVLRGVRNLNAQVRMYLEMVSASHPEEPDLREMELPEDMLGLMYMAASLLQLPTIEKQPLLEAETASMLLHLLRRLYRRETAILTPILLTGEEQARKASWLN